MLECTKVTIFFSSESSQCRSSQYFSEWNLTQMDSMNKKVDLEQCSSTIKNQYGHVCCHVTQNGCQQNCAKPGRLKIQFNSTIYALMEDFLRFKPVNYLQQEHSRDCRLLACSGKLMPPGDMKTEVFFSCCRKAYASRTIF